MKYISTRGGEPKSFTDILLSGTAPDGGLYVPQEWPQFTPEMISSMRGLGYADIAFQVIQPFVGDDISPDDLKRILADSYIGKNFDHVVNAPLVQVGPNAWVLELFHGPTLSFKDYALQFLGRMFDHVLKQRGERVTIVGATSGDTGSAAIEGCRSCENIDIFILHPHERTSDVQRKQMTGVDSPNVYNIALEGTFDDCQGIVKDLFADADLNKDRHLSAVNSINWARIMAQIVYYFASAIALGAPDRKISYAVPTGNFGNVFAAFAAKQMGLPIHQLVIGSNRNDILTRFFETGTMDVQGVQPSLSPSMDIQVSSNFERFLYIMLGRDSEAVAAFMDEFKNTGSFTVGDNILSAMKDEIHSFRCDDEATLAVMKECYERTGMVIDPHTAVGLNGAMAEMGNDPHIPMVSLACAHPAKFPEAVQNATGRLPDRLAQLQDVMDREEKYVVLENDINAVRSYVQEHSKVS